MDHKDFVLDDMDDWHPAEDLAEVLEQEGVAVVLVRDLLHEAVLGVDR